MKAVYTGSFDPVTIGHMDIITRAAGLFDSVTVAILINPEKKGYFTLEERLAMLEDCCRPFGNVRVVTFTGLTADLIKAENADVIVRGIRDESDVSAEMTMAHVNKALSGVETLFLPADSDKAYVSSSIVRQLIAFHGDYKRFLPEKTAESIANYLKQS